MPNHEEARMPAPRTVARIGAVMKLRMILKEAMSPVTKDVLDGTEEQAVARHVG